MAVPYLTVVPALCPNAKLFSALAPVKPPPTDVDARPRVIPLDPPTTVLPFPTVTASRDPTMVLYSPLAIFLWVTNLRPVNSRPPPPSMDAPVPTASFLLPPNTEDHIPTPVFPKPPASVLPLPSALF